jgi:hypothetical protein
LYLGFHCFWYAFQNFVVDQVLFHGFRCDCHVSGSTCWAKRYISTHKDGNHLEKPYEKQMFHNIWLVTRTAGDTSLVPKEHRNLSNDNRVHPLLDRTAQKRQ